jgi:hypothetical protein
LLSDAFHFDHNLSESALLWTETATQFFTH